MSFSVSAIIVLITAVVCYIVVRAICRRRGSRYRLSRFVVKNGKSKDNANVSIGEFMTYKAARRAMLNDLEEIENKQKTAFDLIFENNGHGAYVFSDNNRAFVKYEIIKKHVKAEPRTHSL